MASARISLHLIRSISVALALLAPHSGAVSQEDIISRPGWSIRSYHLDPGVFLSFDRADPSAEPRWKKGIKAAPEVNGLKRNWDVLEVVKTMGVDDAEISAATLDVMDRRLTVYASQAGQELVETMLRSVCCGSPSPLHLEVQLAEFELSSSAPLGKRSPSELCAAAGKTWVIRENTLLASSSGQLVRSENLRTPRVSKNAKKQEGFRPLQGDEKGSQIEVEIVMEPLEPDGQPFNVSFVYRHRGPILGTDVNLNVETATVNTVSEETGAVLAIWPLTPRRNATPGMIRYAALIFWPSVRYPAGRIMKDVFER